MESIFTPRNDNLLLGPIGRFLGTVGDAVAEANQAGLHALPSTAPVLFNDRFYDRFVAANL